MYIRMFVFYNVNSLLHIRHSEEFCFIFSFEFGVHSGFVYRVTSVPTEEVKECNIHIFFSHPIQIHEIALIAKQF